jgi:ATP-dependent Clp protease ATP-binding subunit ClpA
MFERFTVEARQVVTLANENASRLNHNHIGTEHLLLGLLAQPGTVSARVLNDHGVRQEEVFTQIARIVGTVPVGDLDAEALETIGIDLSTVREKVEAVFGPGALDREPRRGRRGFLLGGTHIPFTARAKKVLELSLRESLALKHREIRDGHILLGLIREGEGLAAHLLADAGAEAEAIAAATRAELG